MRRLTLGMVVVAIVMAVFGLVAVITWQEQHTAVDATSLGRMPEGHYECQAGEVIHDLRCRQIPTVEERLATIEAQLWQIQKQLEEHH